MPNWLRLNLAVGFLILAGVAAWNLVPEPVLPESANTVLAQPTTPAAEQLYTVTKVIDGDTIKIQYNGKETSVRLLRIDTPERGQKGYQEATDSLTQLIGSNKVRLEFETENEEWDSYDRLLAYVFVGDKNLSVEQVKRGWSLYWTKYGEGKNGGHDPVQAVEDAYQLCMMEGEETSEKTESLN